MATWQLQLRAAWSISDWLRDRRVSFRLDRAVTKFVHSPVKVYGNIGQLPRAYEDGDKGAETVFQDQIAIRGKAYGEYMSLVFEEAAASHENEFREACVRWWAEARASQQEEQRNLRADTLAAELL